jgi:hypothetical protein
MTREAATGVAKVERKCTVNEVSGHSLRRRRRRRKRPRFAVGLAHVGLEVGEPHEGDGAAGRRTRERRRAVVELLDVRMQQPVLGECPRALGVLAAEAHVRIRVHRLDVALQAALLAEVGAAPVALVRPLLLAGGAGRCG